MHHNWMVNFYWCEPFAFQRPLRSVAQGQEGTSVQECPENYRLCGETEEQPSNFYLLLIFHFCCCSTCFYNLQVGGCCFSELRAAYEVTNDKKNWEIIMGQQTHHLCHSPISSSPFIKVTNDKTRGSPVKFTFCSGWWRFGKSWREYRMDMIHATTFQTSPLA